MNRTRIQPGKNTGDMILATLIGSEPMTVEQLGAALGRSTTQIRYWLGKFRSGAVRSVRIAKWLAPESGQWIAMYALGSGEDARRPKAKTQAERCKDHWKRKGHIYNARARNKRTGETASPFGELLRLAA